MGRYVSTLRVTAFDLTYVYRWFEHADIGAAVRPRTGSISVADVQCAVLRAGVRTTCPCLLRSLSLSVAAVVEQANHVPETFAALMEILKF